MKKFLAILLALAMVFSFAACSEKKEEPKQEEPQKASVEVVKGVTIPSFKIKVCGVKITNEDMAAYDLYKYTADTVNSSGTAKSNVYIGFKMSDVLAECGITGTLGKATVTAADNYEVVYEGDLMAENCFVAISKDGAQGKNGPWFAPCASGTTGDYLQDLSKMEIEGAKAPADKVSEKGEGGQKTEGPTELSPVDISDKSDKITFKDYAFKVNGKEVTNKDLEGLHIFKAKVTYAKSSGTIVEASYSGYVLKDVLEKLGVKDAKKVTVVANDGYKSELTSELIASANTLVAIELDKAQSEDGTIWLAPCDSQSSKDYAKAVVEILAE